MVINIISWSMVINIIKAHKNRCQVNFILGQSMHMSRKRKVEDGVDFDMVLLEQDDQSQNPH